LKYCPIVSHSGASKHMAWLAEVRKPYQCITRAVA
jgi:hypothetical protein